MNKKRLSAFLFASLLLFSCGGPSASSSSAPSLSSETSTSIYQGYTVSFDTHGSYEIESVKYVDAALALPTPTYYHHEFLGWYESESYSGEPVNKESYVPSSDVTLHAKWDGVVYVYAYYGGRTSNEHNRYSKHVGDVISFAELGTPDPIVIDGVTCPFAYWGDEMDYEPVEDNHIMTEKDYILVAVYDESNVPAKKYLRDNKDGSHEATGRVAWPFFDKQKPTGYFSVDISQSKGASGGAGVAFRMQLSGRDYAFEDEGTTYYACVFVFTSGNIQISQVGHSGWKEVKSIGLSSLPESWRNTFNNAEKGQSVNANMAVISNENSFSILINGDLATTIDSTTVDAKSGLTKWDDMPGTGFGIRSSSSGTIFKNEKFNNEKKTIHLNTMGGAPLDDLGYYGGKLVLPNPVLENKSAESWYYDEALTNKVDMDNPVITDGITLYCKYRYVNHPLIVNNGDSTYKVTGNTAGLIGIASSLEYTLEGNFSIKKGGSGAAGFIFRASMFADNTFENDSKYMMVQFAASNGSIQIATNDYSASTKFAHLAVTPSNKSLSGTPKSWQDAYNNAQTGSIVTGKLKIVSTPSKFEVYINDSYMCSQTSDKFSSFTGLGVGVRINGGNANLNFTFSLSSGEVIK